MQRLFFAIASPRGIRVFKGLMVAVGVGSLGILVAGLCRVL